MRNEDANDLFCFDSFGMSCFHGCPNEMSLMHSHCEIELNLLEQGEVHYEIGDEKVVLVAGPLYVFSAVTPHRMIYRSPDTVMNWITISANHVNQWDFPRNFTDALFNGQLLEDNNLIENRRDVQRFACWKKDLSQDDPKYLNLVVLELHARLERMALSLHNRSLKPMQTRKKPHNSFNAVTAMQSFILANLTKTCVLSDVANAVGLHPNYAATLFKQETGLSPMRFLTEQRLRYARFLLATTDKSVLEVALDCGIRSLSRFYAVFEQDYTISPSRYRKKIRANQTVE